MKGNEVIVSKLFKIPDSQLFNCFPIFQCNQPKQPNWILWISEKHKRKSKYFGNTEWKLNGYNLLVFNWNVKMALSAYICSVIFHPVGNGLGTQCDTWYYKKCTLAMQKERNDQLPLWCTHQFHPSFQTHIVETFKLMLTISDWNKK